MNQCWYILASLNGIESNCTMTYDSSRVAFVTTALLASFPTKFKADNHIAW